MRTNRLLTGLLIATLIAACSGNAPIEQAVSDVARTVNEVAITSGEPVTIADLSIEGMSCEQMCGGAIKSALAKLGVQGTEIKMSEDESPNHAIVTYDGAKLSDEQLISAIQALHDGQYKVVAVAITKQVMGGSGSTESTDANVEEAAVSVVAPKDLVLPSIVALIGRLLRI
jgi:copper chaperone CopZ